MNVLFLAALMAGISYWPISQLSLAPVALIAWKGAGVGLLALWAALNARDLDGWLLAAVMAFGAAGDVLLEAAGLQVGAVAFLIGHLIAILLYLRNRREGARPWLLLIPVVVILTAALPEDPAAVPGIALYGLVLSGMAACALMSRFRLAALGAWLFVASDVLILARLGPLGGSVLPQLLVWPLYFGGQALIAWDVGRFSRRSAAPAR